MAENEYKAIEKADDSDGFSLLIRYTDGGYSTIRGVSEYGVTGDQGQLFYFIKNSKITALPQHNISLIGINNGLYMK